MNKLLDWGENLFLILLAAPFMIAFVQALPTHPYYIGLMVTEALSVFLILIRRPGEMTLSPYAFAIAFVGTAAPLLARPTGGYDLIPSSVAYALMFGGLFLSMAAKLALNRSFGIVAANRGIKRGGPYMLVRHPMYLGYFVTHLGLLLVNFSLGLLAIYSFAWAAQILRVIEEERLLMQDRGYLAFARQTRWRLIPGLF